MWYVLASFGIEQASVNAIKESHLRYSPPNRHGSLGPGNLGECQMARFFCRNAKLPKVWSMTKRTIPAPTIGLVQFIDRIIRCNEKCEPFAWRSISAADWKSRSGVIHRGELVFRLESPGSGRGKKSKPSRVTPR
jgi:hypothetical protein